MSACLSLYVKMKVQTALYPPSLTELHFFQGKILNSNYAPNFEKVDGAYCFWSVRAWVGACVGASHFLYLL